jgi:sortase A
MYHAGTLLVWVCIGIGVWQLSLGVTVHAKAWLADSLIENAWQSTLQGSEYSKPWPWADMWPTAQISIPNHDIKRLVLSGDNGSSLAFGPGLNEASKAPGQPGVTLISGHRDTHFRFLKDMSAGDIIHLQTAESNVSYEVVETKIADQRLYSPSIENEQDLLMLVTCYPFDTLDPNGPLRFMVTAIAR